MKTLKKIPAFDSDESMAEFVATADLSEYDLSDFRPAKIEDMRNYLPISDYPAPPEKPKPKPSPDVTQRQPLSSCRT